jgi:hypothetical protein
MEKWEYITRFFVARVDKDTKTFIKNRFGKKARTHSPESMIPELNKLGEEGWEVIHMEPVARVGGKEDVLFDADYRWSSTYFCVLKRRKPDAWIPVASYRPPESQS